MTSKIPTFHINREVIYASTEMNMTIFNGSNCPLCNSVSVECLAIESAHKSNIRRFFGMCHGCGRFHTGYVINGTATFDLPSQPLADIPGLPELVKKAWAEVRAALGVNAYMSAAQTCRKILFYVAVEQGLELPKEEGAPMPDFKTVVKHLQRNHCVPTGARGMADRIREIGNDAAHKIEPISRDSAFMQAEFAHYVLTGIYAAKDSLERYAAALDR